MISLNEDGPGITLPGLFPLRPTIRDNPEPNAVVPHVFTFNAVMNSSSKMYSYRFDEAMRNMPSNALAMRRDAFIEALLQERIFPTGNRAWSVKVPDANDPRQALVSKQVTEEIRCIPHFTRMRMYLMEAIWPGRWGSQGCWGKKRYNGREFWSIVSHRPVNGDKIFFEHNGTPSVAISPAIAGSYHPSLIRRSDRGMTLLMLSRPEHRRQFIIHQHLVTDADYFEPELGGGIHGTGLRNKVYWAWWMRAEMLAWATDFMQKVGTLGLLVFMYEDGNNLAKAAAELAASKASTEVALTMPVPNGPGVKPTNSVMHIPANTGGVEALQKMVKDFLDCYIERMMVGQPSSGGESGNGFGGSAGASLHADTKYQLLKYDAANLDETLTADLIGQLLALNHPDVDFPVEFVSAVANPEDAAKIQGITAACGIGVDFKKDEVRDLTGMSKPEEGDETVGGQAALDAQNAQGMDQEAPGKGEETEPGQGVTSNDSVERENGSGTAWADVAAYCDDGTYFAAYAEDSESGGRWVTIGAKSGDDGGAKGGTPVFIKNGRIVKGPKGLKGKKPDGKPAKGKAANTPKKAKPQPKTDNQIRHEENEMRFGSGSASPDYPADWDEPISQDAPHTKKKPRFRITQQMRDSVPKGVELVHVAELAADIQTNANAQIEYKAEALKYAREASVSRGFGDLRTMAANRGKKGQKYGEDANSLRGFDEIADAVNAAFPGLIDGGGVGDEGDKLFEMLVDEQDKPMKEREAWELAVRYIESNGLDRQGF